MKQQHVFVLVLAVAIGTASLASAQPAGPDTAAPATPPPSGMQLSPPVLQQPPPAYPYAQPYAPYPYPQPYYAPYYEAPRGRRALPSIVGHRTVQRSMLAMWAPGLASLLGGWVLNFSLFTPIANAVSGDRGDADEEDAWAWSLVPIVGPWVQLAIGAPHPAIPVTMGILQLAGLGFFIAGLVTQEVVRVPIYAGDPEDPAAARVDVTASLGGLGLVYTHH